MRLGAVEGVGVDMQVIGQAVMQPDCARETTGTPIIGKCKSKML